MSKRNIKIAIPLILILGLGILTFIRWNAWFGNPEEPAYTTEKKIGRLTLTLGNQGEYSRAFSWVFGEEVSQGTLYLTKVGSQDTTTIPAKCDVCPSRSGKSAYFRAFADQLDHGSTYSYQVRNGDIASEWHQFNTLADSTKESFSFLYFGDIQDSDSSDYTRRVMNEIYDQNKETQFVLLGGDFIERPMDMYYNMAYDGLGRMATEVPILAVTGNHEYLKGIVRKIDSRFAYAFPYYLASKVKENHVFTFTYGNAQFFLLDSNREFWNLSDQREWLEAEMAKSTAKWMIVVLHHPIYSLRGGLNNFFVKQNFQSAVEGGKTLKKIDLVLQAHEHGYARKRTPMTDGKSTTPLYSVSYFSDKAYFQSFDGDYERWGTANRYYQKISINGDSLFFRTYTDQHELYDEVILCYNDSDKRATLAIDKAQEIPEKVIVPDWFRQVKGEKKTKKYEQSIQEWKEKKGK
ncbi:MAG: metallophosphoesterase family protein [Paludibacteraceae bacterium]|nr:metallophosphoesterase family protein [Paludibacteraceae bacterium]